MFFTGKGGVGKTSLACATAVTLADGGKKVLLVSTDPASNLDEVLETKLASKPRPIIGAPGLSALNIDPAEAAREYRERLVEPYRDKLPAATLRSMEEQLSGACTMEIAAFDEFSKLIGNPDATTAFDHVIFDTAPTGHTLRLMQLPMAWKGFLESSSTGTSCLGPLVGLQAQRELYTGAVTAMTDGRQTTLVLVSRPQRAALKEAERTSNELAALGVRNQMLILNGLYRAQLRDDEIALALERRSDEALHGMESFLARMRVSEVKLRSYSLIGIEALRKLFTPGDERVAAPVAKPFALEGLSLEPFAALMDDLARMRRGVIMTMGKGGVGKTTIASAIAGELARRGFSVHLSTTDPAAHVADTIGRIPGVRVSRIDPLNETKAYVDHVMNTVGSTLDEQSRALLEEDLRSPCTEEIAVFKAFARTVADGQYGFIVLDTAPTGHTLLLLDATEAYHREVSRHASDLPEEIREILPRLRDSDFTRVLIVTVPEATPVHEAALLQDDLRRAGIVPYAWIINQSFTGCGSRDPLLIAREVNETVFIEEVARRHAARASIVPWVPEEPVGAQGLHQLFGDLASA
ncbi:MAG TPA: arsenical pump-driving ATPase [Candidatus Krumholzibacteriaceae bacterium]